MTLPEIEKYLLTVDETAALNAAVFSTLEVLAEPPDEDDIFGKVMGAHIATELAKAVLKVKALQFELKKGVEEFNEREENKNA